jgi:hypothetical protein
MLYIAFLGIPVKSGNQRVNVPVNVWFWCNGFK